MHCMDKFSLCDAYFYLHDGLAEKIIITTRTHLVPNKSFYKPDFMNHNLSYIVLVHL